MKRTEFLKVESLREITFYIISVEKKLSGQSELYLVH